MGSLGIGKSNCMVYHLMHKAIYYNFLEYNPEVKVQIFHSPQPHLPITLVSPTFLTSKIVGQRTCILVPTELEIKD